MLTIATGPDELLTVARSLELAAYNRFQPETSTDYKTKMRSLFQNLKIKSNTDLRQDVFTGKIAPEKLGSSSYSLINEHCTDVTNSRHEQRRPQIQREARIRCCTREGEYARRHDCRGSQSHLYHVRIDFSLTYSLTAGALHTRNVRSRLETPCSTFSSKSGCEYGVFFAFGKNPPSACGSTRGGNSLTSLTA
jgi:hypothetical protein